MRLPPFIITIITLILPAIPAALPSARAETLHDKAAAFDVRQPLCHAPRGLILDCFVDPADGRITDYANYGDSGLWTGVYIVSQIYRYQATGSAEALLNVERGLAGLDALVRITGVPGLPARGIYRFDDPGIDDETGPRWRPGAPGYEGYRWLDDTSKSSLTGIVMGLSRGYEWAMDPGLKSRVREDLTAIGDHLIRNDLKLVDWDGEPTTHGDINPDVGILRNANPFDALMSLHVFRAVARVTGEKRFIKFERGLEARGLHRVLASMLLDFNWLGRTNYNNFNIAFLAAHNLLAFERDWWKRHPVVSMAADRLWKPTRREMNALFHLLFLDATSEKPYRSRYRREREEAIREALESLRHFPADKMQRNVRNSDDPGIRVRAARDRLGVLQAEDPLPIFRRPGSAFLWKENPYRLDLDAEGRELTREFPAVDYLFPYWLARHLGLLDGPGGGEG